MKFDDLDLRMRIYETAHDLCVLPGMHMVVRLDGRSFTRLTKETHEFARPFDSRMRDMMLATVEHLMDCGFRVLYGFTQSDEISLLLHPDESSFGRKTRKLNSILAGEASARFSLLLGDIGVFDSRISELPSRNLVVDYFRWRQEDAHRNALNAHCYWLLREQGQSERQATHTLSGMSVAAKNELLFANGANFNDLPAWQKRGSGVIWEEYTKEATNPITGHKVIATRRRLKQQLELPLKDAYSDFLVTLLPEES